MKSAWKKLVVPPKTRIKLAEHDPEATEGAKGEAEARAALTHNVARLGELQELLWAENKRALLIVLQGMDAAGKDGTIRHVMSGLNPQGCRVTGFKAPSAEELDHDYLWRIHTAVPGEGEIGIFNRSHYESVLVERVHDLVPESVWSRRYDQINDFEKLLAQSGVMILKFFLHISREEQRERLLERLHDPTKVWKCSPSDFAERPLWDAYQRAYEDALSRCSTKWAPWHIIPANKKWYRNLAVSAIIVDTLAGADMHYPPPAFDVSKVTLPE